MGGIWERLIRTVRKVLNVLLREHGSQLDHESFHTFLCEVEMIINSRPLTTISDDVKDCNALTPNHRLMAKDSPTTVPPGEFTRQDVFGRKRWKRIQHLSNLFWTRWKREYLPLLQERHKWTATHRYIQINDMVLVKDNTAQRFDWMLGRVVATEADGQGYVCAASVKTETSVLCRPISKLVLLLPKED